MLTKTKLMCGSFRGLYESQSRVTYWTAKQTIVWKVTCSVEHELVRNRERRSRAGDILTFSPLAINSGVCQRPRSKVSLLRAYVMNLAAILNWIVLPFIYYSLRQQMPAVLYQANLINNKHWQITFPQMLHFFQTNVLFLKKCSLVLVF